MSLSRLDGVEGEVLNDLKYLASTVCANGGNGNVSAPQVERGREDVGGSETPVEKRYLFFATR